MKTHAKFRVFVSALVAVLILPGTEGVLAQVRPDQVPMGGGRTQDQDLYPSGDRLQSRYETFPGGREVRGFLPTMTVEAVGDAVRAELEARLPAGFGLQRGTTARMLAGTPAQGDPSTALPRGRFVSLYPLEFRGVPLAKGSDVLAIVRTDGVMLATRERGLPTDVDGTVADVAERRAANAALADARERLGRADIEVVDSALEIWVDREAHGRLAWRIVLASRDLTEPVGRIYWVAAIGAPGILNRETTIYHDDPGAVYGSVASGHAGPGIPPPFRWSYGTDDEAASARAGIPIGTVSAVRTHFGAISGNLWSTTPLRDTVNDFLSRLEVTRGGGTVVSGSHGRYGFTTASSAADVAATLAGPHVAIENQAGAVMAVTRNGSPEAPVDINFGATGEFELAQVTAFYWTNFSRRMAESALDVDPNHRMPTRVNINATCNAFYRLSDRSINFFRAGGACPNTAYSDVVLHEFGHYVDHVNGGILDGGLSEGFGDALAILGTRQACLGRDFLGAGTCLRPADAILTWPPAPGEGPHARGRRYAGFVWELVEQLRMRYGPDAAFDIATELVLATFVANPSSIPDAVHIAFLLDDDDGNLANGTPHFRELAAAADSRNLPRPADPVLAHVATRSVNIGSSLNVPTTVRNLGSVTVSCPKAGRVVLQLSGAAVFFAERTVLRYGFGTATNNFNVYSVLIGNLDGTRTIRWRQPLGAVFVAPCPAGQRTFFANAQKSTVFPTGQINLDALFFTATYVPDEPGVVALRAAERALAAAKDERR